MLKSIPKDITMAVTYKCNARCQMCDIWQNKNNHELSLNIIDNLNKEIKYINLTGGEPFLNFQLVEIVKKIKQTCPKANIIISSNGLMSEVIKKTMSEILKIDSKIGVRISIDGIRETHNKIRGIEIYDKAIESIKYLKQIGVKNLGLAMTVSDTNAGEIKKVYNLAEDLDIQFSVSLVQNSQIYFNKQANKISSEEEIVAGLNYVIKKELSSWNVKRWLRAYFIHGYIYFLKNNKTLFSSGAAIDSLFIDNEGDVYPSNLIDKKLGSLKDNSLHDIWNSKEGQAKRLEARLHKSADNWTICTFRNTLKKHWLRIGFWILINKFFKF